MNEFIEQFLIEARELVDQATDDLLVLEQDTANRERLDSAFRAFHTLKGAAGIIDFDAMARALHAAEDTLASVRSGTASVTPTLVGHALSALDQVLQWLDVIEATGEPPIDADAAADAVAARFAPDSPETKLAPSGHEPAKEADLAWLLTRAGARRDQARTVISYRPDPGCFFTGEDPLTLFTDLPGLLALRLTPSAPWPGLEGFDPFACQVAIAGLSSASESDLTAHLGMAASRMSFTDLAVAPAADRLARDLVEAQILMLQASGAEGLAGRLASASRIAVNLVSKLGGGVTSGDIEAAGARSLEARDPTPLLVILSKALAGPSAAAVPEPHAPATFHEPAVRALRVDIERIDALVRLTGELTVIKNAIGHVADLADAGADAATVATHLKDQHALFDRLVGDLQHSVLSIRVLPLRQVFQRFPRLVRELSVDLGKTVRLETEGDETEADKAIVESLFEPLLHVLRNAIDHGLEDAPARAAAGKSAIGTIILRAARQGEHVFVEVEDDGGGIDLDRVRQVAAERRVASPVVLQGMADADVADLIFAPGFSTAMTVSDVSGRGVGMDAVRYAVERVGGRVSLDSRPGAGTTVRFALPFTVMMTRVMTVEAAGQTFGLPLEAVIETVRVPQAEIIPIGAARAIVLRNRTVPVFNLADALSAGVSRPRASDATIVVAKVGGQPVGLEVDGLGGRMDVMLKPMDGLLSGMAGISGTTLLGDGRVLIVLDLQELLS